VTPVAREALSAPEVAAQLGVSRSALYRLWAAGEGPRYVHVGKRRLIPAGAVREWLDAQQPKAA
jgi:excisionase family DNA binding protein